MFDEVRSKILEQVDRWEPILLSLDEQTIGGPRNEQNRTVRQIVGHMIDSASNNTHRVVHLQYRESPVEFPDYARHGHNDRWIAVQDYDHEEWSDMVVLWKSLNRHFVHVAGCANPDKLGAQWVSGDEGRLISLQDMVDSYLPHLELHLAQIEELMKR